MEVIDHEPQYWFLLREGDIEYLSVRCQRGFMDYSMLVPLTPEEREAAHLSGSGHAYLNTLATNINDHPELFQERDRENNLGLRVTQTVVAWRTARESRLT
jgi:hypothetical protein